MSFVIILCKTIPETKWSLPHTICETFVVLSESKWLCFCFLKLSCWQCFYLRNFSLHCSINIWTCVCTYAIWFINKCVCLSVCSCCWHEYGVCPVIRRLINHNSSSLGAKIEFLLCFLSFLSFILSFFSSSSEWFDCDSICRRWHCLG